MEQPQQGRALLSSPFILCSENLIATRTRIFSTQKKKYCRIAMHITIFHRGYMHSAGY